MARIYRPNPGNPDLFGVDVVDAGQVGLGAALAALANDSLVAPTVKQVAPSLSFQGGLAKLVDAVTTMFSGWVIGRVVGALDSRLGNRLQFGGGVIGVARGISAAVPGYQISAQMPKSLSFSLGAAPAAKQLTNGNGTRLANVSQLGVGTMGI